MDSYVARMEECELCCGLRGHQRIKDVMYKEFDEEYKRAQREVKQLTALFREVCWYNFETACSKWKTPWHVSWGDSAIELHAHLHDKRVVRGRVMESASFPVWYSGPIQDAPPLPPEIIFTELKAAQEYTDFMATQRYTAKIFGL